MSMERALQPAFEIELTTGKQVVNPQKHGPKPAPQKNYLSSGLVLGVAAAEIVDEHLFDWLVVSHEDMADGASADKVADFFGEVLGVIAGALERLGHEDDLQAGLADDILRILDVTQENEVA